MTALLPVSAARRFYDGRLAAVRLNHSEGLAVDERDGALWCGGEHGELYRITPNGSSCELWAKTDGYALGLCRARDGRMFLCDWVHRSIVVFTANGARLAELFAHEGQEELQLPNYPLLSADEKFLYVSDTRSHGPGIWRFNLRTGKVGLWLREKGQAANGLALAPDGSAIFLVESKLPGIVRIPILEDGSAGSKEPFLELPGDEPDGIVLTAWADSISRCGTLRVFTDGVRFVVWSC